MIRELKLRKIGNSVGFVLPKEALSFLRVVVGDTLAVTKVADGSLRLSPATAEVTRQMAVVQDLMKRYRRTLRKLAR